jgi:hypothetical protein
MALATALATELTAQRAPRWKQLVGWTVALLQALVILSMRFHYVTDVVAGCLAAVAATQLAGALGRRLDERFAPWSRRTADQIRQSVPGLVEATWPSPRGTARMPARVASISTPSEKGLADLTSDWQDFGESQRSARDKLREVFTLDQLHDEPAHAGRLPCVWRQLLETMHMSNVRMVQSSERSRFAGEAREPFGIAGDEIGQDLYCHVAIQSCVARAIHAAHAALANLGADLIDAEAGARSDCQADA